MARRRVSPISLSFLDAMTCGFGAVILFYMVINASMGLRAGDRTADLEGEADLLEDEVLAGHENLVTLRNSLLAIDQEQAAAQGMSRRLLEELEAIRAELATFDRSTLSQREHINKLQADLRSLEEGAKRLSAAAPSDEIPGDRLRSFLGDGDRQYLTGLKVGGKHIFILVDASASMLGERIVNIIRRRNMPDNVKIRADKWQQAVATVDWVATQIPRDSRFQIATFRDSSAPVVPGTEGRWLDGGDRKVLDDAVERLRRVVPDGGTSLYHGLAAVAAMRPPPDNLILLVDSLPTQGESAPTGRTVSPKERLRLFEKAMGKLPSRMPVNVILFPMEGDPMAASAYWKVAIRTGGSFLSPSGDWP